MATTRVVNTSEASRVASSAECEAVSVTLVWAAAVVTVLESPDVDTPPGPTARISTK